MRSRFSRPGVRRAARLAWAAALLLAACGENQAPKIISLSACPGKSQPGDSVELSVDARDPEKGRLLVRWATNGGELKDGEGPTNRWYSPERPGRYKVWVTVLDQLGAKTDKSITLEVSDGMGRADYEPPKGFRVPSPVRRPGGRNAREE